MKKILLLTLILFIIPFAFSQEPIYNAKYLDLSIELSSSITLVPDSSNYDIDTVTANLSFTPLNTWRQDVQDITTTPTADLYDDATVFTWEDPSELNLDFSLKSNIRTVNDFYKIRSKINFPLDDLPEEVLIYTKPSEKVDSQHNTIIAKANELAAGEDDLFVVTHKLGEWVHAHIEYNLSTVNAKSSIPASTVLQTRQGVCDEITVLFMAMSRALGIPARFVSGISYTNSDLFTEKWGPHGWAEVYFPGYGWVPFDVTYDELGFIDASHITSKISIDPDDASLHYQWIGRNIDLKTSELDSDVEITNYGDKIDEFVKLIILPVKADVGFGGYNLLEVRVENLQDYYVTTTVYLARTTDLSIIEPYARPVILKPGQKKKIFWTAKVRPDLDDNYIYTFPAHAYTIRNTTVKTEFSSKKDDPIFTYEEMKALMLSRQLEEEKEVSKEITLSCTADKKEYASGEEAIIECVVENKGNFPLENLQLCHKESCQSLNIGISAQGSIDFVVKTTGAGRAEAIITASNDDVSKSTSVSFDVLDKPFVIIEDINSPSETKYGEEFDISFIVKKESFSNPKNVEIILIQNGLKQKWDVEELTKNRKMVISFRGTELSVKNEFEIVVNYKDDDGDKYTAENSFNINLIDVTGGQRFTIFLKDILRAIERLFS